ncbi:universal stress protein [Rahnella sp. NRRL B-41462]|uniref:universal stress protein n=1 Tax=Rahnella sp. NRRL B-41462 TaxID=1610579 RepID=UPI001E4DC4F9|nr:universal stress protein [Rahnella sp. NRRL B-41462]
MKIYARALILIKNDFDGKLLLQGIAKNLYEQGTKITLGHFTEDYCVDKDTYLSSEPLTTDRQSKEVIEAKSMHNHLLYSIDFPADTIHIVTNDYLKYVEDYVTREDVDLVIRGMKTDFSACTLHTPSSSSII